MTQRNERPIIETRTTRSLYDARNNVSDAGIKKEMSIIEFLCNATKEEASSILPLIEKYVQNDDSSLRLIYNIISYMSYTRQSKTMIYAEMIELINENYHQMISLGEVHDRSEFLAKLLHSRGFFKDQEYIWDVNDNETYEIVYNHRSKDPNVIAIINDDVDAIQESVAHGFDINSELLIDVLTNRRANCAIELAAEFCSIKCFKFLLLSGAALNKDTTYTKECSVQMCAIRGGNMEIIHVLSQHDVKFDKTFGIAVKFLHNDICDWLLQHYVCESCTLYECLQSYNIQAFMFFLQNGADINSQDNPERMTALHSCYLRDMKLLTRFCIQNGAKEDIKNARDRLPKELARK